MSKIYMFLFIYIFFFSIRIPKFISFGKNVPLHAAHHRAPSSTSIVNINEFGELPGVVGDLHFGIAMTDRIVVIPIVRLYWNNIFFIIF